MSRAKIYTKTGDSGQTRLVDGSTVQKHDARVEAYGTIDELNSFLGLLRTRLDFYFPPQDDVSEMARSASCLPTNLEDNEHPTREDFRKLTLSLAQIQSELFVMGSLLATEKLEVLRKLPQLESPLLLEQLIDKMDQDLPSLQNFILPGGHELASLFHICRTICRRAERQTSSLIETFHGANEETAKTYSTCLIFLNRLSDFFFTAARWSNVQTKQNEILWKARGS